MTKSTPPSLAPSRATPALLRLCFGLAGTVALVVGVIGIVVPLLPTTPFVLLAAYCYARASTTAYRLLIHNRLFGPMIHNWQHRRCIAPRSKATAIALVALSFTLTVTFAVTGLWLRLLLVALALLLIYNLWRIPSCRPSDGQQDATETASR